MLLTILRSVGGAILALNAYFLLYFLYQSYRFRRFRGPPSLPLIGSLYDSKLIRHASFIRFLADLRRRYGKIFKYFALMRPYLVICDPLVARRVLTDTKSFPKGTDYTYYFGYAFGDGLVTSTGDKYKKDKQIFHKYFIKSNIVKFTGVMNRVTSEAVEELSAHIGGEYNIEHFFSGLAIRTFMNFMMGKQYTDRAHEREMCEHVSEGSFTIIVCILLSIPMTPLIPPLRRISEGRAKFRKDMLGYIAERRQMLERGEGADLDDVLAAMMREKLSDKDMIDHYVTLLSAGHDTTSYFSSYMCYLLSQHPEVQERVYREIQSVVKDGEEVTGDHVSSLKFLQCVMQETLRLYAVIPWVSRISATEMHIKEAGITIPKGASIFVPMYLLNRDPEIWDNPAEFMPERFEGQHNEGFTTAKNGFFPFGYGTRTCIGNTLAQIESTVFMVQLLKRFKLLPAPGFKPQIIGGISLTTANGINVVLSER